MLEALIAPVSKLLDKFIPDADTKIKLAHELSTMAENHAQELATAQIKLNTAEAAHKSLFVAGWRPFIGWTCGISMAFNYIFMPLLGPVIEAHTEVVMQPLELEVMMPVLMGMLGLGGMRSFEKNKGVARQR